MTPCYCYIVECADGTFYTGWTTDPERRLKVHNKGLGARYTKMRRPVKLVHVEELPDKISAMKRERAIKRMKREGKMILIGQGRKNRTQAHRYTRKHVQRETRNE